MDLVRWIDFPVISNGRGRLVPVEAEHDIPFEIRRVYYMYQMDSHVRRGLHAHRRLRQVAVCIRGGCSFLLDDGRRRETVRLDQPFRGLIVDPMVWHEMDEFTPDAILVVFADQHYDESDYIRTRDEFDALVRPR